MSSSPNNTEDISVGNIMSESTGSPKFREKCAPSWPNCGPGRRVHLCDAVVPQRRQIQHLAGLDVASDRYRREIDVYDALVLTTICMKIDSGRPQV